MPFEANESWSIRRIVIIGLWIFMLYHLMRGIRFIVSAIQKRASLQRNGWLLPPQGYSLFKGHLGLFQKYGSLSRATLYMRNHPPKEFPHFPRSYVLAFSPFVTVVNTIDPDVIQYILTKRNYPKAPYDTLKSLLGDTGMLTSEGDVWSHKRRMFNNGFKMDFLRTSSTPLFQEYAKGMIKYGIDPFCVDRATFDKFETLRYLEPEVFDGGVDGVKKLDSRGLVEHCKQVGEAKPPAHAIDFLELFSKVALDIIGHAGFGHFFGFTKSITGGEGEAASVNRMVQVCLTEPAEAIRNPFRWLTHRKETKEFNQLYGTFMQMGRDIVTRCREREVTEAAAAVNFSKKQAGSILDLMVRMGLENVDDRLEDAELLDEVMTFLIAGHEVLNSKFATNLSQTTANAMGFALVLLLNHPHYWKRAVDELDGILGAPTDFSAPPSYEQQQGMKFLHAVFKETLRLYPIAPASFRVIKKDNPNATVKEQELIIDGKPVPDGTPVLIPYMALHRDEELWGSDAGSFRPERWMYNEDDTLDPAPHPDPRFSEPPQKPPRHSHAYIPFSAGPRNCIGSVFAAIEFKILMGTILHRYDLKLWRDPRADPEGVKNMWRQYNSKSTVNDEAFKKSLVEWASIDGEVLPYTEGITLRLKECHVVCTRRS